LLVFAAAEAGGVNLGWCPVHALGCSQASQQWGQRQSDALDRDVLQGAPPDYHSGTGHSRRSDYCLSRDSTKALVVAHSSRTILAGTVPSTKICLCQSAPRKVPRKLWGTIRPAALYLSEQSRHVDFGPVATNLNYWCAQRYTATCRRSDPEWQS